MCVSDGQCECLTCRNHLEDTRLHHPPHRVLRPTLQRPQVLVHFGSKLHHAPAICQGRRRCQGPILPADQKLQKPQLRMRGRCRQVCLYGPCQKLQLVRENTILRCRVRKNPRTMKDIMQSIAYYLQYGSHRPDSEVGERKAVVQATKSKQ